MRVSGTPQQALGRVIWQRRQELQLTQERLAQATELNQRTISGIEAGIANPTWHAAKTIAHALGWSVSELARAVEQLEADHDYPTIFLA